MGTSDVRENSGTMRLCLFINPTGHHQAAWRHPDADADAGVSLEHYRKLTLQAEAAHFDALFIADNQNVRTGPPELVSRVAQYVANLEPLTLLGALSGITSSIGFIATASTTYNYPYQLARKLASLDWLSNGRIGWNIVTSAWEAEAPNFGLDQHLDHDLRYEMAHEFVEVCHGLWDSWDDDAFVRDRESGQFSNLDKMHTLNHEGRFFKVRGPLNVPRSPQGYPLHVQAGTSEPGRSLAARYADMMFTTAPNIEVAQSLRRDMEERLKSFGRNPGDLKIMPGLMPLVGRTESEAREKHAFLQSLLTDEVALHYLSQRYWGFDFSKYDLDGPVPLDDIPVPSGSSVRSAYDLLSAIVKAEQPSIRALARKQAVSLAGTPIYGSPGQIVDYMEEWFRSGACDGFNIQPPYLPGAFDDFVELVVPELKRRGLMRLGYEGRTLRDHFGIGRPVSRYQRD